MFKTRPLIAIFLIVFVDVLAFTLVLPYLPFFAEHFGASPAQVGFIITVFAFCQFLSGPILGQMSDQMGRKPVLILSQMGTCLGFIILALANSLWMVYLARIIDGITAGNITVAQAAMSDVTEPHERVKAFSLIGVAFGLGFFVGPAFSGILIQFGPQAPAWGAALVSFISILATTFLFKDSEKIHSERKHFHITRAHLAQALNFRPMLNYLKHPQLRPLLIQFAFFNLSFSAHISCFALFAERRLTFQGHPFGPREVGYLYAYLGLLGIVIRSVFISRMIHRIGEKRTAYFGFIAQGLGFMSYAWVTTVPGAIIAATIGSFGSGVIRPALAALMSHFVSPKEQGALFGVSQSMASIASVIAPLVAGFLLGHFSPSAWAFFAGASVLMGFFFRMPRVPETPHASN